MLRKLVCYQMEQILAEFLQKKYLKQHTIPIHKIMIVDLQD
jgi:hypothetical protein